MTAPIYTTQDLRDQASAKPDAFNPFWVDQAKALMVWAADVIDQGEIVIKEFNVKMREGAPKFQQSKQITGLNK